jgi:hypothetical protein
MFSKCANPEDGGGVKRIIMGLDRHTRYATFFLLARSRFSQTLSLFGSLSERLVVSVL